MAKTKRLFKSFSRLLFPVILLVILAATAASVWLVHMSAQPPKADYLVTPDKYGQLSTRGARVTDETWTNHDGTTARGWLLRGVDGAPAVILLHRYGADRSYVLDLGVKLNEASNFTVLMPDQRGHGANPPVGGTSFGGCETDDTAAAIRFLREIKSDAKTVLVGPEIGLYGVEMGGVAGLKAAALDASIKAIAVDSVPMSSDDLLSSAIEGRYPFASFITSKFASFGTYLYYFDGCYGRGSLCDVAGNLNGRDVFLLAGLNTPALQRSTEKLSACFPEGTNVETKTDLNPSGYALTNASLEQSTAYDQKIIDFFKGALGNIEKPAEE